MLWQRFIHLMQFLRWGYSNVITYITFNKKKMQGLIILCSRFSEPFWRNPMFLSFKDANFKRFQLVDAMRCNDPLFCSFWFYFFFFLSSLSSFHFFFVYTLLTVWHCVVLLDYNIHTPVDVLSKVKSIIWTFCVSYWEFMFLFLAEAGDRAIWRTTRMIRIQQMLPWIFACVITFHTLGISLFQF